MLPEIIIGNTYFYENKGRTVIRSKVVKKVGYKYVMENGDEVDYFSLFDNKEKLTGVRELVDNLAKSIHVPVPCPLTLPR